LSRIKAAFFNKTINNNDENKFKRLFIRYYKHYNLECLQIGREGGSLEGGSLEGGRYKVMPLKIYCY